MKTSDFDYHLPEELIAYYPLDSRSSSRLLIYYEKVEHKHFSNIVDYLSSGDLLVVNNTSVIPARIFGTKESGGAVEIMLERIMEENKALVQIRSSKTIKIGTLINLGSFKVKCIDRQKNFYILQFDLSPLKVFNSIGHVPLPPYIDRIDDKEDLIRYQTVYAKNDGAVAAPTAGLHFDESLLFSLSSYGIDHAFVTLHVGAGTFQPVKVEDIKDHKMHSEYFEVCQETVDKIVATKESGGRIVAVGTTAVRTLESMALQGGLFSSKGDTDIFIYPGFEFRFVDAMITNFHTPKSTLIMMVSAFGGKDFVLKAYKEAIKKKYNFFSYGDAMMII